MTNTPQGYLQSHSIRPDRKDIKSRILWICGSLFAFAIPVLFPEPRALAEDVRPPATEDFGKLYHCKPGPWGDLEYYYIYLEAPDRVVDHLVRPDPTPKWCFPGGTDASLRALFASAGLSVPLQNYLLEPEHRVLQDNVMTVFPPVPDLLAMTPEQRAVIYSELAKSPLNVLHVYPACITHGDVDTWFSQSQMRPEIVDAVKKMTYMRGEVLCFSDISAILSMVDSEKEAHDLMKTMSRTASLVLQLNVKNRPDFTQAIRYWSASQRNEEIASIILPAVETDGIERLDCVHLLPSLARRYLYTYPSEELAISALMPDCSWTALNFFSAAPLNYHADDRLFLSRLADDYDEVSAPYSFGDVLMMAGPDGVAVHSCVYIADDIVYTKNGQNPSAPWILSKLGDVQRLYTYGRQTLMQGYRIKLQSS
jgi:hypothetical protein